MSVTLGELRTKDGENLFHLLCAGTLRDRKQEFKKFVSKGLYAKLKEATNALKIDDVETAVKMLHEGGCDVNGHSEAGDTPLSVLCDRTFREVQAAIERGKKHCVNCETKSLTLLKAILETKAKLTEVLIKRNVNISLHILTHNQRIQGKSWSLSSVEMNQTPLGALSGRSKQLNTDICRLILDKLSRARVRLEPEMVLRVLCVFLDTIHTDVNRGEVLVHLLQSIGIRYDDDPAFAHELLSGNAASANVQNPVTLHLMDQVISALAGAKGSDAICYRCAMTGTTPFHITVAIGLKDVVCYFLQHPKMQINILDDMGNNPLMVALNIMRHSRVSATNRFSIYLKIAHSLAIHPNQNFDIEDRFGSTALLYCLEVMSALGSHYREQRLYAQVLHDPACRRGTTAKVVKGQTAAMMCVVEGLSPALESLLRSRHPVPDLMATDSRGRTALHLSALYSRKECADMLIEACPALCGVADNRGQTPLFYLVENFEPEDALQLLTKNAKLWEFNRRNSVNQSALDYYKEQVPKAKRDRDLEKALTHFAEAAQFYNSFPANSSDNFNAPKNSKGDSLRKSFARMLRSDKAEAAGNLSLGTSSERERKLSDAGEELRKRLQQHVEDTTLLRKIFEKVAIETKRINASNVNTGTAVMLCSTSGLPDELSFILDRLCPDLNLRDGRGMTALHMAAEGGKVDCVLALLSHAHININIQDKLGNSALFYIVEKFTSNEAVKILASYPWNFDLRNNFDQTAYEYYVCKLTQRHLNEELANVLARRCVTPLPRLAPERLSGTPRSLRLPNSNSATGTLRMAGSEVDLANQKWRTVLKKYRIFFMENFDNHPVFFSYIIQEGVMDEYTSSKIQNIGTNEDMATEIIRFFAKKGEHGFRVFLEALRKSNQEHIADTLENAIENDYMYFDFDP